VLANGEKSKVTGSNPKGGKTRGDELCKGDLKQLEREKWPNAKEYTRN